MEATEMEKQYVSAVFSRMLDGPALDTAFASSREAAPEEVWEALRVRYEPSSRETADSVWGEVYRRKLHNNETSRSHVNWLQIQFAGIRESTGVPRQTMSSVGSS
uniref:Uncharacterized protein n=1 Tax=Rhodosorus marinus TaxID=101924 RepID=A0A7S3A234_9RHOD|mmetsp:Transcript_39404/g.156481  ORF Transcript_39404/g.156481 Transcript_39404/m.156481 type:complete len:105 (+) Transcript_39404:330-644(+)